MFMIARQTEARPAGRVLCILNDYIFTAMLARLTRGRSDGINLLTVVSNKGNTLPHEMHGPTAASESGRRAKEVKSQLIVMKAVSASM